jgi:integrase
MQALKGARRRSGAAEETVNKAVRPQLRPLFELLVGTGMRLGEVLALRVCDLRFGTGETRALVEDAKSAAGVRAVFVRPWVTTSLQRGSWPTPSTTTGTPRRCSSRGRGCRSPKSRSSSGTRRSP